MHRISIGLVLTAPFWVSTAFAADAPAGDAVKGRQLYMAIGCTYCHGTAGQGGGGRTGGLRISNQPTGFAAFLNQLRNPVNEMPPYVASVVPDKDVADLFAFVSSIPRPPDARTIPILNN